MNNQIPLYEWVRANNSIQLARISKVEISPGDPGQEIVKIGVVIEKTFWGEPGKADCGTTITRPASPTARAKFPDPLWGRVTLEKNSKFFLVTPKGGTTPLVPIYAEDTSGSGDPVFEDIQNVLKAEGIAKALSSSTAERTTRYLEWLAGKSTVKKLFGAQALALDAGKEEAEKENRIASAFAGAFDTEQDEYLRLSIGDWMWNDIYERATPEGRVAILNATMKSLANGTRDIQAFSIDRLVSVNPEELRRPGIVKTPEAARVLEERMKQEDSEEVRKEIKGVLEAIR